jgi:hypothetical protein
LRSATKRGRSLIALSGRRTHSWHVLVSFFRKFHYRVHSTVCPEPSLESAAFDQPHVLLQMDCSRGSGLARGSNKEEIATLDL